MCVWMSCIIFSWGRYGRQAAVGLLRVTFASLPSLLRFTAQRLRRPSLTSKENLVLWHAHYNCCGAYFFCCNPVLFRMAGRFIYKRQWCNSLWRALPALICIWLHFCRFPVLLQRIFYCLQKIYSVFYSQCYFGFHYPHSTVLSCHNQIPRESISNGYGSTTRFSAFNNNLSDFLCDIFQKDERRLFYLNTWDFSFI